MALKFFFVACLLVACVAAEAPTDVAKETTQEGQLKRDKKDVLLSTLTYPVVQPAATPLLRTVSPISTIPAIDTIPAIHPYYRTVFPYSHYYPYNYPYSFYPNSLYYLRK